ncbi:Beta-1,3-galactosyltransferase 15 [Platanthera zijinensis]|uniref:Beta-1,3-galactosyltransferase 15 n=1 Tax=Platanthera zijinensis TaxID=2320716 RepID=A0AAP0FX92_9ASPA
MKKWFGGLILLTSCFGIFAILLLRYVMVKNPLMKMSISILSSRNYSEQLSWVSTGGALSVVQNPKNESKIVSTGSLIYQLSMPKNLSFEEQISLQTWNLMMRLVNHSEGLPEAVEGGKEAVTAWEGLMNSLEDEKLTKSGNGSKRLKEKQCPYSVIRLNVSEFQNKDFRLKIPCGLVQGSSLTIVGTPEGILGNFKIDLVGTAIPGEEDPPIVLHYNVRLHGDKVTDDPVIVQNTWTSDHDWGSEERCPSPDPEIYQKVDDLGRCSDVAVGDDMPNFISNFSSDASALHPSKKEVARLRRYFPFMQGYLAVSTLRVGAEGIHMSVNGKHITSFAFRETLESWIVNEARISGDIKLLSVLASGLPTSEDSEYVADLDSLKSAPLRIHKRVDLFIGVFSTTNNFKRRMAVRRTWMQYDDVRSGAAVIRFFVGLHKNQVVNEVLWSEARTYGDIQLMPFVDYYSLITLKTVAICIYGTNMVSAKFVMKTDDDAFVRIDEVLSSLNSTNVTHGLLYGKINSDDQPNRDPESKWYISPEMFRLEDVAMGIWTDDLKKGGMEIKYVADDRIRIEGCEAGYIVAHYQQPREMMCLWQKLRETNRARCCDE